MPSTPNEIERFAEIIIRKAKANNSLYDFNNFHSDFSDTDSYDFAATVNILRKNKLSRKHIGNIEVLTDSGKFFSTFEDKRNSQMFKQSSEDSKLWYDSQNAKNVFDDYPKVKSLSIWAIRISVAALILSLVKLIAELLR